MKCRVIVALVAAALFASCFYRLDRFSDLKPGDITGAAVRPDQELAPAPFALLTSLGTRLVRRASAEGRFAFHGLPPGAYAVRLVDDADGDGWPNRVGFVAARLVDGERGTTFVDVGAVKVEGTMSVDGSVVVAGGDAASEGLVARVFVARDLCVSFTSFVGEPVSCDDAAGGAGDALIDRLQTGAEAETSVDGDGKFRFLGVGPGDVHVVAAVYDESDVSDGSGALGALRAMSSIVVVSGGPDDPVVLSEPIVVDVTAPLGTRTVQLTTSPPLTATSYVVLRAPGAPSIACADSPPAPTEEGDVVLNGDALPSGAASASDANAVSIEVPVGVHDVHVCIDGAHGVLRSQLAPPASPPPPSPLFWGPVTALQGVECDVDGVRDCDGDGVAGLDPPRGDRFDPSFAPWRDCAATCALELARGDGACETREGTRDCDDDGDGQANVSEPLACYGPGRGTDLDNDALCSVRDPFPQCAANVAALCEAGTNDVTPLLQDDYVPIGPFDRDFGARGRVVITRAGEERARAVGVDSAGRILVAGSVRVAAGDLDAAVWRFLSDGTVDEAFADGGLFLTGLPGDDEGLAAVVDDDALLVAGHASSAAPLGRDITAWRVRADGTLDEAFGTAGVRAFPHVEGGGAGQGIALGARPDGTRLLAITGFAPQDPGVDLLTIDVVDPATGALDPVWALSFSQWEILGVGQAPDGLPDLEGRAVVIDDVGNVIVAADSFDDEDGDRDELFLRFDEDAALVAAAGHGSLPEGGVPGQDMFFDIAIDREGRFVAPAITTYVEAGGPRTSLRVKRIFGDDGALDEPFCIAAKSELADASAGRAVAIDDDGLVLVAGDDGGRMLLARLEDDGRLDESFFGGRVVDDTLARSSASAMVLDAAGRMVIAGDSGAGADADIVVWRVVPNDSFVAP
jgi:uncharacterized delta-60 repeat protein